MIKRAVTIQDISCFGKCSLTAALPLISAMGVETVVVPTAVLSTHTGGFTGYTFRDLTEDIPLIAKHWKQLKLHFDGIYTGYLGSPRQVQEIKRFFDDFKDADTKIIVDPVMGDNGRLYAGFTADFADGMRKLCEKADVIVPNMTEACLLLGMPYKENYNSSDVKDILRRLTDLGSPAAVLTGICYDAHHHGAALYDRERDEFFASFRDHIPEPMHGTGDVFASVLTGALMRGASLESALFAAVNFTSDAIEATVQDLEELPCHQAPWYGVEFEACIGKLIEYTKKLQPAPAFSV